MSLVDRERNCAARGRVIPLPINGERLVEIQHL
jgi:hypothetical protein